MAGYQQERELSVKVNTTSLVGKQYYIVAFDTTQGGVVLANAQTLPIAGILKTEGVVGDIVNVVLPQEGTMKVKVGSAGIAINTYVTADTAGLAVATTNAGDMVIGRALQAGNSGDIIEIALMYFRY